MSVYPKRRRVGPLTFGVLSQSEWINDARETGVVIFLFRAGLNNLFVWTFDLNKHFVHFPLPLLLGNTNEFLHQRAITWLAPVFLNSQYSTMYSDDDQPLQRKAPNGHNHSQAAGMNGNGHINGKRQDNAMSDSDDEMPLVRVTQF